MGQANSPLTSRLGYTIHWSSMWDSKLLYTRKIKEDFFLNFLYYQLLHPYSVFGKSLYNMTSYEKQPYNKYFQTYISNYIEDEWNYHRLDEKFLDHKTFYTGKLWILRYQSWLVLSFFLYTPYSRKKKRKLKKTKKYLLSRKKTRKTFYFNDFLKFFLLNQKYSNLI